MLVIDHRWPLASDTADHLLTYLQRADSHPAVPRQYWVVNGRGELLASGGCDDRHISVIPAFTNRRDPATGRYERVPRQAMRVNGGLGGIRLWIDARP